MATRKLYIFSQEQHDKMRKAALAREARKRALKAAADAVEIGARLSPEQRVLLDHSLAIDAGPVDNPGRRPSSIDLKRLKLLAANPEHGLLDIAFALEVKPEAIQKLIQPMTWLDFQASCILGSDCKISGRIRELAEKGDIKAIDILESRSKNHPIPDLEAQEKKRQALIAVLKESQRTVFDRFPKLKSMIVGPGDLTDGPKVFYPTDPANKLN